MNTRYKGRVPLKRGERVDLLDDEAVPYETIKVDTLLASQFTVTKKNRTRFFFYQDKGITWRPH